MTTDQITDDAVLRVGGEPSRDKSGDLRQFIVVDADDNDLTEVLTARRPKMGVLLDLAAKVEQADASEDIGAMVAAVDLFLDSVMVPESAAIVRAQLSNPDDDLDIEHLGKPMQALVGLWYRRPTGRQAGSPSSRSGTGKRSTARSRSGASTRKR